MQLLYRYDPSKWYLGTKCINGHTWPGTQLSLRRIYWSPSGVRVNHCPGCRSPRPNWLHGFIDNEAMGIPNGYKLGKLCSAGHLWEGHELTLRRNGGKCIECEKIRHASEQHLRSSAAWRAKNKERINAVSRDRIKRLALENPELFETKKRNRNQSVQARRKAHGRESGSKYGLPYGFFEQHQLSTRYAPLVGQLYSEGLSGEQIRESLLFKKITVSPSVLDLVNEAQRIYWKENPGERKEYLRKRRSEYHKNRHLTDETYRLYHRQKSKRRKALIRGSIGLHITGKQVQGRFRQFDHCCAYCGRPGDLHIEHVIPISMGGPHVLGNVVPACKDCNFSKRDKPVESWYRSQSFFCEKRWRKICRVLGIGKGSPSQLSFL